MLLTDILADLAAAFPRTRIPPETFRVMLDDLADLPVDVLADAARDLRRTSEWFPTIKAIREAVAERMLALPTESEALAQVEGRVRWSRDRVDGERGGPVVHPLVSEALDHVGGFYALRTADEPTVVRGQFLRLYRDARAARIRDLQTDGVPQLQQGRR